MTTGEGFWPKDKWKNMLKGGGDTRPHVDSHRKDDGKKAVFLFPSKQWYRQRTSVTTCQTSTLVIFLVILGALSTATHIFIESSIQLKNSEPLKKKQHKTQHRNKLPS